jgi:hypothetical protein
MKKLPSYIAALVCGIFLAVGLTAVAGQGPLTVNNSVNASGYYAPSQLDVNGNMKVNGDGWKSSLNIAASAVLESGGGGVVRVIVNTAGSTAGAIYDNNSLATGNTAANLIFSIPNTVGVYYLNFPTFNGIVVNPGSSQVLSVSYE